MAKREFNFQLRGVEFQSSRTFKLGRLSSTTIACFTNECRGVQLQVVHVPLAKNRVKAVTGSAVGDEAAERR